MRPKISTGSPQDGFALVATLSLLILLAILALGMLSLSSISLRSSSHGSAQAEARANARMALMIALGELQKATGPDMRITAPADVLDVRNPPLTGVWKSWEGSNQKQGSGDNLRGRPIAPIYTSKTIPASTSGGRFVSWLVSGTDPASNTPVKEQPRTLVKAAAVTGSDPDIRTVPLVSGGSLASTDLRQVHLVPQKTVNNGAYAWWISGENQKALAPKPYDTATTSNAEWADRNRSHAVADPEPFGMNRVLADPLLAAKAITRGTADFIADGASTATPTKSFHDLSADSMGLLTNVATGGWRKDLSLLTEKWDEQPTTGLEFFKISPTESLKYTRPDPANPDDYRPTNSMLYHWADHRTQFEGGRPIREFWTRRGPISSWARLKSHATLYKKMSATSSRMPNINHQSWQDDGTDATAALAFHEIRLLPQMARIQIIVSHYAKPEPAIPGNFRPAVLYTPVLTMWNPYNTRITLNGSLFINPAQGFPLGLSHKFSSPTLPQEYWAIQNSVGPEKSLSPINGNFTYVLPTPLVLEPGETRIFSPAANFLSDITNVRAPNIALSPGVRLGVGTFITLDRRLDPEGSALGTPNPALVSLPGGTTMEVDAKFDISDLISRTSRRPICGNNYQWFIGSAGSGRSHSWFQLFYEKQDADKLYPPLTGLASDQLLKFSTKPMPFLSMILGSRIANFNATATKGMVQANPVVETFSSSADGRWTDRYPGSDNLLNFPWDFSVVPHPSGGGDMLPNVDITTNSSYIVTGVTKGTGVSRMVVAELPTRPLASLAELSQMQIRSSNPTPPYAADLVANSDATPLIPADGIVNPSNTRANARNNEQQDDSYCLNQLLFDDWFFSSIAPEPDGYGNSPPASATLEKNYTDLITGTNTLTNRAYYPIAEDKTNDAAKASATYTARVLPADSWKNISSRLEVEGMFNVNSTSVKAWRTLLGHARNQKIPYTKPDGSVALSQPSDYVVSRTSVAGDMAAGQPPQTAGDYADTTEFTGYRVYNDNMLDFLAGKIVEQVQRRGPFLSLSEFVNRKLTSDASELDLALAGAVQTALNKLTAEASLNPFEVIQTESVPSKGIPVASDPTNALTGYVFPEAAVGHNTYGLPGWTRQADILRPLAPILSARDDTFTIRAYGSSRAADGTVKASAWCEAVVTRKREFVDPSDQADITSPPTQPVNAIFGRRFDIISFRWLHADEV